MLTEHETPENAKLGNLMTEEELAAKLGVPASYLQRDRCLNKDNPKIPYIRLGRLIRYEPDTAADVIKRMRVGDFIA